MQNSPTKCLPRKELLWLNRTQQEPLQGLSDNAAGAIAYITIIPAIVFLLVEPYNKKPFVRFHAWQCIFLYVACIVWSNRSLE